MTVRTSPRRTRLLSGLLLAATLGISTSCSQMVNLDHVQIAQPAVQTPPAISVPLYIVHDVNKVPPALLATGEGARDVEVHGLQTFLTRDVKASLQRLFTHVDIIPPGTTLQGIFLWLDVQIHWIRLERMPDGNVRPLMNWSMAMYAAGKTAYVWQKNSIARGPAGPASNMNAAISTMFTEALGKMQESYSRQDVYSRLQRLEQSIAHAAQVQAAAQ